MSALGTISLQLPVQSDNTIGTRWRTPDSKTPGSSVVEWTGLSALSNAIAQRTTGTAFNQDVRQYLTGTGAATATIELVYVSGSAVSPWAIVGDDLENPGDTVGNGFFKLRATPVGGNSVDSVSIGWSWTAPATDTAKPARVTGISINPVNGALEFTWDASSDSAPPGVTPSGLQQYELYKDGVLAATIPAASPGVPFNMTASTIGSVSPSPGFGYSSSNDGEWMMQAAGSGWHNTATENMYFLGSTFSGDGVMIVQVAEFDSVGSYRYSTAGIMVRESRSQGAPLFSIYQEPSDLFPRAQVKARLSTGTNATNKAQTSDLGAGTLLWLKVERIGNTLNGYYSTNGVMWTLLDTQIIPMATTVEWGLCLASQVTNTPVTAIFRNVSITNSAAVTYTLNPATGTALYQILARDFGNNASALSPGVEGTPLTAPATTAMKFAPGHYMWMDQMYDNSTVRQNWVNQINALNGNSAVKGVCETQVWKSLEKGTDGGDYSNAFEIIDQLLALCAGVFPQKKLIFQMTERGFNGYDKNVVLPSYIISRGWYIQNDTGTWSGGLKCIAKIWDPQVMDRWIALAKAIIQRYNDNPLFIMFGPGGESTVDGSPGDPEFTNTGYFAQLQRLYLELKPYATKTPLRLTFNYSGLSDSQYDAVFRAIVNGVTPGGVVIGGPDPEFRPALVGADPTNAQRTIYANEYHRGNSKRASDSKWIVGGGHDWRDEVAWVGEQQAFGYQGVRTGYDESVQDIFEYQRFTQKARYMVWMRNDWAGTSAQKWNTGILPYINSINGAINTTKPSIGDWEDPS